MKDFDKLVVNIITWKIALTIIIGSIIICIDTIKLVIEEISLLF